LTDCSKRQNGKKSDFKITGAPAKTALVGPELRAKDFNAVTTTTISKPQRQRGCVDEERMRHEQKREET